MNLLSRIKGNIHIKTIFTPISCQSQVYYKALKTCLWTKQNFNAICKMSQEQELHVKKVSLQKDFRFSSIFIPKSSKLHRCVKKVRKVYNTRYKCNHKHDPKVFYLIKVTAPKKTYLLSYSSRLYHVIMKLKCKALRFYSIIVFL